MEPKVFMQYGGNAFFKICKIHLTCGYILLQTASGVKLKRAKKRDLFKINYFCIINGEIG
jgi:hypothetical protein